jgi:hypothetical protein
MLSRGPVESNQTEKSTELNPSDTLTEQVLPDEIEISIDTLKISMNGRLRKVALFKDNLYCMFESGRENTSRSFKKMIVIDKKGDFIEDVFIPEGIQDMSYYDIVIENDSLFLKRTQFDEETFLLGKYVADFKQIERRNFSRYQDSSYKVFATCNGEWGGTIFFKDLQTEEVYEASSTCPIVINKINGDYYVTNYMGHMIGFAGVLKIPDPRKLHKSEFNFDTHQGSQYHEGVVTLLDTMDFYIPTSFVVNGELRHLYSDEIGTYIGKIENGKVIPIYKFDFKFYAHFNQQDENGRQVLSFNIPESEDKGVLIIEQGKLKFYIMN